MKIITEQIMIDNEPVAQIEEFSIDTQKSVVDFMPNIELSEVIKAGIQSEKQAIEQYSLTLQNINLTEDQRINIEEIKQDEEDHIIILTSMLEDIYKTEYPGRGQDEASVND